MTKDDEQHAQDLIKFRRDHGYDIDTELQTDLEPALSLLVSERAIISKGLRP